MTALRSTPRHPSAGELVRQLDGELDPRAQARLDRHLERCAECRERMATLAENSREASGWLAHAGGEAGAEPRRRAQARAAVSTAALRRRAGVRVRRGWAAAAAVAALAVVTLSADPLRAWVMDRLAPAIGAEASAPRAASLPPVVVGAEGSVISFTPVGAEFTLQVERAQPEGSLLLRVGSEAQAQATAQVTNGGAEEMLVLPAGLRIENSEGSRASYRVTLPASVRRVTVRVGEAEARSVVVGGSGWSEEVRLSR